MAQPDAVCPRGADAHVCDGVKSREMRRKFVGGMNWRARGTPFIGVAGHQGTFLYFGTSVALLRSSGTLLIGRNK